MIFNSIFLKSKAKRSLLGLAIGAFSLTAALACTGIEGIDAAAAQAIVQNVDTLSGEVTVQFKDGTTTTFNLADIDVEALGLLIGEASLQTGDEIEVELDDSKKVLSVKPHVANVTAMIVEVDVDANTMKVEAFNGVQLVLTLTVDTRIELDDHERGTTGDLVPGMMLKVKYDTDSNVALKIKNEENEDHDAGNEIKGVIEAISSADHTITVRAENGVSGTYTVLADTEIKIHRRAPFGELTVGMLVKLELDSDSAALLKIEVKQDDDDDHEKDRDGDDDEHGDEGEFKGVITAINAVDRTLTVVDEHDRARTYAVNSDTEIKIYELGEFSDLEVGMLIKLKFDSASLEVRQIEVKVDDDDEHGSDVDHDGDNPVGELHGVISSIQPDARSVTVANSEGVNVTYTANADTDIVIGEPASFENLEVGMQVRIWFNRENLNLVLMHVRVSDD